MTCLNQNCLCRPQLTNSLSLSSVEILYHSLMYLHQTECRHMSQSRGHYASTRDTALSYETRYVEIPPQFTLDLHRFPHRYPLCDAPQRKYRKDAVVRRYCVKTRTLLRSMLLHNLKRSQCLILAKMCEIIFFPFHENHLTIIFCFPPALIKGLFRKPVWQSIAIETASRYPSKAMGESDLILDLMIPQMLSVKPNSSFIPR
jgi:hypothetical protein